MATNVRLWNYGPEERTIEEYFYAYPSGSPISYTPNSLIESTETWLEGRTVPNYHQLQKEGKILPHTYFRREHLYNEGHGTYKVSNGANSVEAVPFWHFRNYFLTLEELTSEIPTDMDYFVQQAAARVYSSGYDVLTFVGELGSLISLYRNFLKKFITTMDNHKFWTAVSAARYNFRTILDEARKGKSPATALRDIQYVAGEWLQVRYGLRPLLYDLQGLYDAIHTFNEERKIYSEKAGFTNRWTDEFTTVKTTTGTHFNHSYHVRTDWEVSSRGAVTALIEPARFQANPFVTGWELTTLSFVFDWVINVGQALESISFLAINSQYTASAGYKITAERFSEIVDVTGANGWNVDDVSRVHTGRSERVERIPTKVSILPQPKIRLNPVKVVDLLALIVQRIGFRH